MTWRDFGWLRWWHWALAAGLVFGVGAGAYGNHHFVDAPYVSTSQVLVTGQFADNQVDSAYTSNQYVNQRMSTYAQIASSEQVTGPAARAVGSTPDAIASDVTAEVNGDTTVMTLTVTGSSPQSAFDNSTAVTRAFVAAITKLETPDGNPPRVGLNVITNPTTPTPRTLPLPWVWLVGGALVGAGLVVLAGWLLRWLYPKWSASNGKPSPAFSRPRPVVVPPERVETPAEQLWHGTLTPPPGRVRADDPGPVTGEIDLPVPEPSTPDRSQRDLPSRTRPTR